MDNTIILIFSGYNPRAIVAFIRTLVKNNLDFRIVAKSSGDFIFFTEYKNKVISIRENQNLELNNIIEYINLTKQITNKKNVFIAPTSEAFNRFFLEEKNSLNALDVIIPLVNKDLYSLISDKYSFTEVCKDYDILVPKEYFDINIIPYPFVAKPKSYSSESGEIHVPQLIFCEADKLTFLNNYSSEDFYFQEFISGKSFYLLYYFTKENCFYKYSQLNKVQQPNGKSIIAAISSNFHEGKESKKYEDLFKALGFYGLVMIEVKNCNSRNYMIEANPRFWGPSQLFVDAGVNLFEAFLYDYNLIKTKPIINLDTREIRYFWHGGYQESNFNNTIKGYQSKRKFIIEDWLRYDIYNRQDTLKYYLKETNE
jgi:predicted ATP-grasp superfamily ATP-dependent carboligase